jgi:hypothetical protein
MPRVVSHVCHCHFQITPVHLNLLMVLANLVAPAQEQQHGEQAKTSTSFFLPIDAQQPTGQNAQGDKQGDADGDVDRFSKRQ